MQAESPFDSLCLLRVAALGSNAWQSPRLRLQCAKNRRTSAQDDTLI